VSNPTEPDARDASEVPDVPTRNGDGAIESGDGSDPNGDGASQGGDGPSVNDEGSSQGGDRPLGMSARIDAVMASVDDDDEPESNPFDAVTIAVDPDAARAMIVIENEAVAAAVIASGAGALVAVDSGANPAPHLIEAGDAPAAGDAPLGDGDDVVESDAFDVSLSQVEPLDELILEDVSEDAELTAASDRPALPRVAIPPPPTPGARPPMPPMSALRPPPPRPPVGVVPPRSPISVRIPTTPSVPVASVQIPTSIAPPSDELDRADLRALAESAALDLDARRRETMVAEAQAEAHIGDLSDASIPIELSDAESEVSDLTELPSPYPSEPPPLPQSELPLEHRLESPTAIERAIGDLGEAAWEARAVGLTRRLDKATDRAQIADLAYELGELCERRLVDEARAVKAFGRALASDPSLRANLWAIRRVFYRRGLWPNLIKLIDAESRFARDDDERADLCIEKATILADKLNQADDARAALEDAVLLAPGSIPALIALERVTDDPARQVELWAQLASAVERPERKLVYLLDQIRFWTDRGADLDRARELLLAAAALGVDPERVNAERLRVAELANDRDELQTALDAAATQLLSRAALAGMPDPSLAPAGGSTGRAATLRLQVVAIRRRQAQAARAVGSGDKAWDYLQSAIALAPGEPILLADLADVAEELGRYDELADLVQSWQAIEGDPSRALGLSIRRADALLRAGQREPALALLESLEASAPGLAPVVALRERDALAVGDAAALAEAWTRAGDAARIGDAVGSGGTPDPASAVAAYVAAAHAWTHDVGGERGDAAAQNVLAKALEIAPSDPIAIESLVELHERAGRVDQAAAALAGHDEPEALQRLARMFRSAGRVADALEVDRRRAATIVDPVSPEALAIAWRIDAALEELGKDEERMAHLVGLADRDPEPARRGYARVTAARLAEAAGNADLAIELYRRTLEAWPDDGFAHAALRGALRRVGRWDELATLRRAEADGLSDGPEVARALREAAWLYEDRLAQPREALAVYRQLLERAPDDVHARAGAVRAAIAAGELGSAIRTLELSVDDSGDAALAWAQARERAGELDDAGEAYLRAEAASAPSSVSGAQAALAAAALAATRGDTIQRVAATRALAARAGDPAMVAALHEDLGWLYALVLEDFDEAAVAFEAAASPGGASPGGVSPGGASPGGASPGGASQGALLGAALVAARRQDSAGLATAYERLAARLAMPEAAAALHLRSAAIATAAGEHDAAMARVAAARAIAPDDVGALLVSAEQQVAALPPARGEDVVAAVDRLLARAEILAMRATLADDPAARDGWELDRADALEAAGRLKEAGATVTSVLRTNPRDVRALEALVRLAERGGDRTTEARAAVALAQLTAGTDAKRALYARAAAIFDPGYSGIGKGTDAASAIAVLRHMLVDDPGSPVFDRLCELLRPRGDLRTLLDTLGDRLAWVDGGGAAPQTAVPILSERAQLLRGFGDLHGAAADLDTLLARAPDHGDALRRRAEAAGDLGDAARAVELWQRYLAVETQPAKRVEAELILARTLAEDLGDVGGAIEQVERVIAQRPGDLVLRERLVGLANQAEDWVRVVRELREIARLRMNPTERARDELRLGQIARDRLRDRGEAAAAFERGRQLDPLSLELLREQTELAADRPPLRVELIGRGVDDLRRALDGNPGAAALYDRLATVFGWQGDRDGVWLSLVALEALGAPSTEQRAILATGRERAPTAPSRQLLDPTARAALRAPGSDGVLTDLWRAITPAVTQAVAFDAAKLGFVRGDRIAQKSLAKKHEALATALASLGVDDVELYVSEARSGQARVLSGETPVVCVGADLAGGATSVQRFLLGRAVWQAADGSGTLADLKDSEIAWFVIAALKVAKLPVPQALAVLCAGEDAAIAERTRLVDKHLSRRDTKSVVQLGPRLGEIREVANWRRAMMSSSQRAGLLFGGDLGVALAALDIGRGGRHVATDPTALDLVRWSVSAAHLELRRARQLAVSAGGTR